MIIAVLYLISNTLVDKVAKFIDGIHNLTLQENPTHFSSNDVSRNRVKSIKCEKFTTNLISFVLYKNENLLIGCTLLVVI